MKDKFFPQKVKVSEGVLFQEIEGESVLLNMENEKYFGLDEIGTHIWHLLAEDGRPENVLKILKKEYEADAEILQNDLFVLIDKLKENGLIEVEN